MSALLQEIEKILSSGKKQITLHIPYANASVIDGLYKESQVLRLEYREDCIEAEIICTSRVYGKVKEYLYG